MIMTWLLITKLSIPTIRFLFSLKATKSINLDNIGARDVMGGMTVLLAKTDIMLYRLISTVLNINAFG